MDLYVDRQWESMIRKTSSGAHPTTSIQQLLCRVCPFRAFQHCPHTWTTRDDTIFVTHSESRQSERQRVNRCSNRAKQSIQAHACVPLARVSSQMLRNEDGYSICLIRQCDRLLMYIWPPLCAHAKVKTFTSSMNLSFLIQAAQLICFMDV